MYHGLREVVAGRGHFRAIAVLEARVRRHCVCVESVCRVSRVGLARALLTSSCAWRLPGSACVTPDRVQRSGKAARVTQQLCRVRQAAFSVGSKGITGSNTGDVDKHVKRGR